MPDEISLTIFAVATIADNPRSFSCSIGGSYIGTTVFPICGFTSSNPNWRTATDSRTLTRFPMLWKFYLRTKIGNRRLWLVCFAGFGWLLVNLCPKLWAEISPTLISLWMVFLDIPKRTVASVTEIYGRDLTSAILFTDISSMVCLRSFSCSWRFLSFADLFMQAELQKRVVTVFASNGLPQNSHNFGIFSLLNPII